MTATAVAEDVVQLDFWPAESNARIVLSEGQQEEVEAFRRRLDIGLKFLRPPADTSR